MSVPAKRQRRQRTTTRPITTRMNTTSKTTVNVERRTWDKEAYEARARSRAAAEAEEESSSAAASAIRSGLLDTHPNDEPEEFLPAQQGRAGPLGSSHAYLKSRVRKVDLEGKLGSTELIDPTAASTIHSKLTTTPENPSISSGVTKCKDGVGWHCRVCDCFLKDSLTYLDHINGRKHQRYLGYTMRVEQSTTAEVGNVLKSLAESEKMKQQQQHQNFGSGAGLSTEDGGVDYEMVIRNKDEETQRRKADRARRREERKRREKQEKGGTSSSGVVLKETRRFADEMIQTAEELEGQDEFCKLDNEQEEKDDDDDDPADDDEYDSGINPMAAMMGFTGFGGSKK